MVETSEGVLFWLDQIHRHGNLLTVVAAPDADHMGQSAALKEVLVRHPYKTDLVRKDYDGDLELTNAGLAALSRARGDKD